MNDKVINEIKLISFFQSLPDELLGKAIANLDANRHYRRGLSKIKNNAEKVSMIMREPALRKSMTYNVYDLVKEQIPLSIENADYDTIVSSINEENKNLYCIFFFRWCYEYDKNGESNDRYFGQFVNSELPDVSPDKIPMKHFVINKNPIKNNMPESTTVDKNESVSEVLSENEDNVYIQTNKTDDADDADDADADTDKTELGDDASADKTDKADEDTVNRKKNTMVLIGHIEKRNTFYNFFPQFELKDGKIEEISPAALRRDYPDIGGINLSISYSDSTAKYFQDKKIDNDDDTVITNAYIVKIDSYYLDDNNNDIYKVKLNLSRIVHDGIALDKIIIPACKNDIYKVVNCEYTNKPLVEMMDGNVTLTNTNIAENENVVMLYNGKYYGPYKAKRRIGDGKYYIKPDITNYLVPFYPNEQVQCFELEKQSYYDDPTETQFIYATGSRQQADIIPDEVLLKSVSENISLESATESPDEFINSYMNMPFVSTLPDSVAQERLERLQRIISDTEAFSDIKQELLSSLLKSLPDTASNLSNQMATESQEYKDLQSQYLDERNKNEENEKLIQKLRKDNQEKEQKITELDSGDFKISSDEAEKLKEELNEYKRMVTDITEAEQKIKKLRDEQSTLETNNEYLRKKSLEYNDELLSAQDKVSNAIKTGIENVASRAFDPFLSNRMMREAASWDAKEEKDIYALRSNELSKVQPSSLYGDDLIDYIVDYVSAKRDYSRNDIINIFTCVTQNFLTVFSGEPGTGKTSMCNIIGDILGLNQFGKDINRFVSVSVERGWSSKRDFIGYYNPLTKKYDKNNSKVFDALQTLDLERDNSQYPYLITLDEANLSQMEYYWSDFMRLADRTSELDSYINIGTENDLFVPRTLRFLATINTDQTTESLSPRLIDRACIIKLPEAKLKKNTTTDMPGEHITWDALYNAFAKDDELSTSTETALESIYGTFKTFGMSVSPRIMLSIEQYIKTAQSLMTGGDNALAREIAIDYAVVQKLLPKINGYYSDYEQFFKSIKQLCEKYNLNKTSSAIEKIEEAQGHNMGYCQYLI